MTEETPRIFDNYLGTQHDDLFIDDLVSVRLKNELTQAEVAERMGVSRRWVSNFENHKVDPQLSLIRRYALAVGAITIHTIVPGGNSEGG